MQTPLYFIWIDYVLNTFTETVQFSFDTPKSARPTVEKNTSWIFDLLQKTYHQLMLF